MRKPGNVTDFNMTFDNIYSEYYQRCFLFAKSYLHDEMLSKDIASEAMITLWTTMKTEEVDNIRAFLMTVVKNQSLNHLRNEHLRMEARENILNDELYELDSASLLWTPAIRRIFSRKRLTGLSTGHWIHCRCKPGMFLE